MNTDAEGMRGRNDWKEWNPLIPIWMLLPPVLLPLVVLLCYLWLLLFIAYCLNECFAVVLFCFDYSPYAFISCFADPCRMERRDINVSNNA